MSDHQDHPLRGVDAGTDRDLAAEVDALRADVAALVGRFDGLQRRLIGDGQGTLVEQLQDNLADVASGEAVGALWDEVRAVRAELDDGLVVEPSDALSASLDALRAEVDGLRDALGERRDAPGPAAAAVAPEPVEVVLDDEAVLERLSTIQMGIDELRGRLDEGLVLADDTGLEAVADRVASLRDFVASELDTVRETVAAAQPSAVRATIDPDTIDSLREDIRAAGAVPDQVIDALREELKALRRRIAVKATERVLDEQQLAQIADAVAERLAEDREQR